VDRYLSSFDTVASTCDNARDLNCNFHFTLVSDNPGWRVLREYEGPPGGLMLMSSIVQDPVPVLSASSVSLSLHTLLFPGIPDEAVSGIQFHQPIPLRYNPNPASPFPSPDFPIKKPCNTNNNRTWPSKRSKRSCETIHRWRITLYTLRGLPWSRDEEIVEESECLHAH
jgi:hypothetical protein